jgi:membrane fusion protein (multidrug efflux system)
MRRKNRGSSASWGGAYAPWKIQPSAKPAVIIVAMLLAGVAYAQEPPATVSTTTAHTSEWRDTLQAVGSIRAVRGADLAAEVAGVVDSVSFESGADVDAGTVLLRLRPNDDAARLADLQASADLAVENLARDTKQYSAQAVSQATMDTDHSRVASARAQVAQQQALMRALKTRPG